MMKRLHLLVVLLVIWCAGPVQARAEFDFSLMVDDLNVAARSDLNRFKVEVASEFGVSARQFDRLAATLGSAGDAYLCLRVGKLSGRGVDEVVQLRRSSPGAGWGKIAQQMGIKPGSDAFMQLKQKPGKQQKKAKQHSKNKKK